MLYLTDEGLKDPTEKEISKSNSTVNRRNKSSLFLIKLALARKLFFEDLFSPVLAKISRTVTVNNILPTLPEPS